MDLSGRLFTLFYLNISTGLARDRSKQKPLVIGGGNQGLHWVSRLGRFHLWIVY